MLFSEIEMPNIENDSLKEKILSHLDNLTKPKYSLGRLEELALQYFMIKGILSTKNFPVIELYTFAGDHGITEENITPFPSEVTKQMVINMINGGAAVSVMCKKAAIKSYIVDIGVKETFDNLNGLVSKKIKNGTSNFKKTSAMTENECIDAINVGISLANDSKADIIGVGEMGIGNSSSASALYSLLLDINSDETVGPGTGSYGELLARKKTVIKEALSLHKNQWDKTGFDALRRVGGFEIAGIVGMILGAAKKRVPVVVDGFIASSAALVAIKINPKVKDFLFFSHLSKEKFHKDFCKLIGIKPILNLEMHLGEGTGAVLALQIIEQAINCFNNMATFNSAGVSNEV